MYRYMSSPWLCCLEKRSLPVHSSSVKMGHSPTPPLLCLLTGLAELTCTVSMTMEKERSWQSRASR